MKRKLQGRTERQEFFGRKKKRSEFLRSPPFPCAIGCRPRRDTNRAIADQFRGVPADNTTEGS